MPIHPTVHVEYADEAADIDIELAPLVYELWRAGIGTSNACQDVGESLQGISRKRPHLVEYVERHNGRATLSFDEMDGLMDFCEMVVNAGPRDDLYERIRHWAAPGAWDFGFIVFDFAAPDAEADETAWAAPSVLSPYSISATFPRSDIAEVIRRLQRYNLGKRGPHTVPRWNQTSLTAEEAAAEEAHQDD